MKPLLLTLVMCLTNASALKVLVIFPLGGVSHAILGDRMVDHLLAAGHEVTFLTTAPRNNTPSTLTQIPVTESSEKFKAILPDLKSIVETKMFTSIFTVMPFMWKVHWETIQNEKIQNLINDQSKKFDVVVAEWVYSDVYVGFQAIYDCPFIWFSSVEPHWMILSLIDENPSSAYTPDALSASVPPFSFINRISELSTQIIGSATRRFYMTPNERNIYQEYMVPAIEKRGRQAPSFDELLYNSSLILVNGHSSLGIPIPLSQNVKCIAGYHVDTEVKPLQKDIQRIMDSSTNGVIYFSMGSTVKSKDMSDEMKRSLLEMFGELKQTIIWKFEEDLTNKPNNVHVLKWASQQSILSHPNTQIFITHGGYLSTNEAVYWGVPIIGIPIFGDQGNNVNRAVRKGFAKRVDISSDYMVQELKIAIDEMIRDPGYKQKAKELSVMYNDRIVPPAKEMVFWIEHVVKTKGAPHLRSPALTTPWYQKMYLDLLLLILTTLYVMIKVIKHILTQKQSNIKYKTN